LYFGLHFYHCKIRTEEPLLPLPVHIMAERIGCPELYDVINEDIKVLCGVGMGEKVDWSLTGWFSEVGNAEHVYPHPQHHPQHATCSSTFLSQIQSCTPVREQSLSIHKCCSHLHHDNLQPYFLSNTPVADLGGVRWVQMHPPLAALS